jgi:hypothetical protein
MGCSFYDTAENTALHTDICSPIATCPTWSRLTLRQKDSLESKGSGLWHSLVRLLAPDAILASVAGKYFDRIKFRVLVERKVAWRIERVNPYEVYISSVQVVPYKPCLLVFGKAAQTPFGKISNSRKEELGGAVRQLIITPPIG